jgi:hypothetical protein
VDIIRILIHSTAFLLGGMLLQLGADHTKNQGLALISSLIEWGSFLPFAIAASSALHKNKTMIIAITVITVLLGQPGSLQDLSTQLSTIGAGLLIGTGARNIIIPERRNDGTPNDQSDDRK